MINEIKKELKNLKDEKYQIFSSKLTPNVNNILGVRLPLLRKIAKKIAKNNYKDFFKENDDEFMELTLLEAMVIGYLPCDVQKDYIKNFIPKINNWSVCDCFCAGIKNINKDFLEPYFISKKEYDIRFVYVILLQKFIEKDYNYVIEKISKFDSEAYYAKMGASWCLSICFVKNYNKTIENVKNSNIHPWVLKKGITKAIESFRLTKEQKEELKRLRNSK